MEKENLINSLVLNLNFTDEKDKNRFISDSDELYNDYCFPIIDEVISRLGNDHDADIDDITVDLGTVNIQDFQNSLSKALEEAVLKELIEWSRKPDSEDVAFPENDAVSETTPQILPNMPVSVKSNRVFKEVTSYLFFGTAPWYMELADFHPNEDFKQLLSILQNDITSLKTFLSTVADNDIAFFRLQGLLNKKQLCDLCMNLLHLSKENHRIDELLDNQKYRIDFQTLLLHFDKTVLSTMLRALSKDEKSVIRRIMSDYQNGSYTEIRDKKEFSDTSIKEDMPDEENVEQRMEVDGFDHIDSEKVSSVCAEKETILEKDNPDNCFSDEAAVDTDYQKNSQENCLDVKSEERCEADRNGDAEVIKKRDMESSPLDSRKKDDVSVTDATSKKESVMLGEDSMYASDVDSDLETADSLALSENDAHNIGLTQWKSEYLLQIENKDASMKDRMTNQFVPQKGKLIVVDAGLVLLHPFLPTLFSRTGLLDEKNQFKGLVEREKAAHFLRFASGEEQLHFDHLMNLEKVFCGLPVQYPLMPDFPISDNEKKEINNMLESVCQYWKPLNGTSTAGLQQSFLRRNGNVSFDNGTWLIRVEGMTVDILMDDLPWEISTILFPWTEDLFVVDWQRGY